MTPHLPSVTGPELARIAEKMGFRRDRQSGSHAVFYRAADHRRIVIPMHQGQDLRPKTLLGILHDMDVTVEALRDLL